MAKINTYTTVTPSLSDKVIGTDASNDSTTNNFLISDIVGLIPSTTTTVTPALDDKATILDTSDGSKLKNATLQSIKDLFGGGSINGAEYNPEFQANNNVSNINFAKTFYVLLGSYVSFSTKFQLTTTSPNTFSQINFSVPIASTFTDQFDAIVTVDNPYLINHASCLPSLTTPSRLILQFYPQNSATYYLSMSGFYKIK